MVDGFLLVTISVPHAQRWIYQCWFSVVQEGLGMEGYIAVKWIRPGSQYDGVVQYVPTEIVDLPPSPDELDEVLVWWPSRAKAKTPWTGVLVPPTDALPPLCSRIKRSRQMGTGTY